MPAQGREKGATAHTGRMHHRMDPTTLRAALRRTPFCPFRLVTDDGSSHEVRARDQAVLTSTEIAIAQEWPGEDLPRCILTVTLSTICESMP